MKIYHNSQNTDYRKPFGAAQTGGNVQIRLDIYEFPEPVKVSLHTTHNGIQKIIRMKMLSQENERASFATAITLPEIPGLLFYFFRIESGDSICYYGNNPERLGGEGCAYEHEPVPYQITVYKEDSSPDWYKEGIVYQIFPDRFARSEGWKDHQAAAELSYYQGYPDSSAAQNPDITYPVRPARGIVENWSDVPIYPRNEDGSVSKWLFHGGDLDGIRSKLDYLADLGVTVLYLNPIFRAASNHKYDTSDYLQIDEAFGDEDAFAALCADARAKGIRIILDGVFNHTGADSKYFNLFGKADWPGACQGRTSPYYDWFTFTDDGYESWWGVRDLPDVRELTGSYMDFIYREDNSVINHWMKLGASGWRLDVADELPDEFIRGIRTAMMKEDPGSMLLGEVWEDASNKTSYGVLREYFWGNELQAVMNYPFRTASLDFMKGNISSGKYAALLMSLKENYPRENFYSSLNLIGSHDRARILNELSDTREMLEIRINTPELSASESEFLEKGLSRDDAIRAAFTIPDDKLDLARKRLKALTLLQFVMPGVPCIYYGDEAGMTGWEDPYNRGPYPWGDEDTDLIEHYRFLCRLRKDNPLLINGDFLPYACSDHVICFERYNDSERFRLYVNRGIFEWEDVDTGDETFTLPPLGWKII